MYFTSVVSGSSGNCLLVSSGSTTILVDGGCSIRAIKLCMAENNIPLTSLKAMMITHEHADHISGASKICRNLKIPLYASEKTWQALPFYNDYFSDDRHIFKYGLEIGDLSIDFFRLSHDAVQPVGLVFSHEGTRVGIVTDTGSVTPSMLKMLYNVDGLILEANHDVDMLYRGPYPYFLKQRILSDKGHLSNRQAGELLVQIAGDRTRKVLLSHLSTTNNTPDHALTTVTQFAKMLPFYSNIDISVAPRSKPHSLLHV